MDATFTACFLIKIATIIMPLALAREIFLLYKHLKIKAFLYFSIAFNFAAITTVIDMSNFLGNFYYPSAWIHYAVGVFAVLGVAFIAIAIVKLYRTLRKSLQTPVLGQTVLLKKNMVMIGAYLDLTNRLAAQVAHLVGSDKVRDMLRNHIKLSPFLRDCNVTDSGTIDAETTVRFLERTDGKEGMAPVCKAFSHINLDLLNLYSTITSPKNARIIFEDISAASAKQYGRFTYKFAMPILLFWNILEPNLKKCKKSTILKVKHEVETLGASDARIKGVEIAPDGRIAVDKLYEPLYDLPTEESVRYTISVFSTVMNKCYPIIRQDLGKEVDEVFSKAFSDLLEKDAGLGKHGLLEAVPGGVEIPTIYRVLKAGNYLIEEPRPLRAFEIFTKFVKYNFPCLCITQSYPNDVRRRYGLGDTRVVWLTKQEFKGGISPSDLDILRDTIAKFVKKRESVVLLDGLEYLITTNGFDRMLKFLHDILENVAIHHATLIMSVNPCVFDKQQLALFKRSMEVIKVET